MLKRTFLLPLMVLVVGCGQNVGVDERDPFELVDIDNVYEDNGIATIDPREEYILNSNITGVRVSLRLVGAYFNAKDAIGDGLPIYSNLNSEQIICWKD
jgi:hypothetical protein